MNKLAFLCIPFFAMMFFNLFKEVSIHDTVGQTISFKAEMSIVKAEPESNYKVTVLIKDYETTFKCIINSKDLNKELTQKNITFSSHEIRGLRLWKGREFVGYQVNRISEKQEIYFQTKSCNKV